MRLEWDELLAIGVSMRANARGHDSLRLICQSQYGGFRVATIRVDDSADVSGLAASMQRRARRASVSGCAPTATTLSDMPSAALPAGAFRLQWLRLPDYSRLHKVTAANPRSAKSLSEAVDIGRGIPPVASIRASPLRRR